MSITYEKFKNDLTAIAERLNLASEIIIENTKDEVFGHLATNLALLSAKHLKQNPLEIALKIKTYLDDQPSYASVEVAGPGFINVSFNIGFLSAVLVNVLTLQDNYAKGEQKNYTINLELVSANPTGILHIGHARNAAIGDSVRRIAEFAGYNVQTEYYVNDAGHQINVLALTVFVNYLWLLGVEDAQMPEEYYGGDVYKDPAQLLVNKYGDQFKNVKYNNTQIEDPRVHEIFRDESTTYFLAEIKKQLAQFGVEIQVYTSEKEVYAGHQIEKILALYKQKHCTYEKEGALWLETTKFGDSKDRVLIKSNGDYTYITPDLATHNARFQRAHANKYINFWGGDHHGYIVRMQAGLALLGYDKDILEIDIIQMVRLLKNGQEYKMSKRKGTAVWLLDLIELVGGPDPIRYMLTSKTPSSHMDLNLDIITKKNATNPVYYAQYATARCFKILEQAQKNHINPNVNDFSKLTLTKEIDLIFILDQLSKVVELASKNRLPHYVSEYIQLLVKKFHSYYAETKIVNLDTIELSAQRLGLVSAILQVLSIAFNLIGINVVKEM